jgi:predicted RNA-binding protein with TRAM domain
MSYGGRGGYGGGYGGGRYGDNRGSFGGPKPVEMGKEYDVQISETSRKGDGIARIQGFVIFVVGGKVGQKVRIRITNIGARFATAEVVGTGAEQQEQGQAAEKKEDVAPQVSDEEKPELQDYKSTEGEQPSSD